MEEGKMNTATVEERLAVIEARQRELINFIGVVGFQIVAAVETWRERLDMPG